MLKCTTCNKNFNYKRGRNSHTRCGSCAANTRRHAKKQKAIQYKGGSCSVCGYNKCYYSMIFHHLDPNSKDFDLGGNHCRKWETIKAELDKCVLLCHNCHGEVHAGITVLPKSGV